MDLPFLAATLRALLAGVPLTLALFGASVLAGGVLAGAVAALRVAGPRPLRPLATLYVFVFRGTPLLVQLFLIYYGLGQFPAVRHSFAWPFLRDPFWCSVLTLALNTGAYTSEILRGALAAVPAGEVEAARACGMGRALAFRRVVAPNALRLALPSYATEVILMTKATSLASIVTLRETMFVAAKLNAESYRAVEVFLCAGVIYLALSIALARLVAWAEWRLSPHLRRPPAPLPGLDGPLTLGTAR